MVMMLSSSSADSSPALRVMERGAGRVTRRRAAFSHKGGAQQRAVGAPGWRCMPWRVGAARCTELALDTPPGSCRQRHSLKLQSSQSPSQAGCPHSIHAARPTAGLAALLPLKRLLAVSSQLRSSKAAAASSHNAVRCPARQAQPGRHVAAPRGPAHTPPESRPCPHRLLRSTSAFLQQMLEKRRPMPLMAVRAYMIFCLPSTFVFSTRRMCVKLSLPTRDCVAPQEARQRRKALAGAVKRERRRQPPAKSRARRGRPCPGSRTPPKISWDGSGRAAAAESRRMLDGRHRRTEQAEGSH